MTEFQYKCDREKRVQLTKAFTRDNINEGQSSDEETPGRLV